MFTHVIVLRTHDVSCFIYTLTCFLLFCGRRDGLMVSELDSGLSGPGWGHCVVFLGKTLDSHSASLHPGV